jgi:prepilin-type N-terminal cleavage/methylation domain-containing protein
LKNTKGFSLLELLIVVAIILIIATIAIPSLLRSRQAANESAAVANLRTINTAQVTYLTGSGGLYGGLSDLQTAGLIDSSFSSAVGKSGYTYSVTTAVGQYTVFATPTATNSGRYGYYTTADSVIRWQTATSTNCAPCYPVGMAGNPVQ